MADVTVKEERSPPPKRTKTSKIQLKSGHDCLFTKEPPQYLQVECSICLCVLSDPILIDCSCSACFCRDCIEPTLRKGKPCPLCNGPFTTTMADRRLQRTLNSLEVYCSLKEAGCDWEGEMGAVSEHLNLTPSDDNRDSGCSFVQLDCSHCKEKIKRKILREHEENDCSKRPYKCHCCDDYESTFEDVTTEHISVCPSLLIPCANECGETLQRKDLASHLETTCPLHVIECSFRYAGCIETLPRKDMPAHIKDNLAEHMSLQAISTEQQLKDQAITHQQQLDELKTEVQNLKSFVNAHLRIMPVTLVVDEFSIKKVGNLRWNSEPFYTHSCGYKMTASVFANGEKEGSGTHVTFYIFIQRSDFDYKLMWPFRGTIRIELLDQESENHYSMLLRGNINKGAGLGYARFISHANLSTKYLKNDSLIFRLSYETVV